jgi:hypothetical protein
MKTVKQQQKEFRKLAAERRKLRGEQPADGFMIGRSKVHIALGLGDYHVVDTPDEPNVIPFPKQPRS